MTHLMPDSLISEYEAIVADLGDEATDGQIIDTLVEQADWTDRGAETILMLARQYGTFVLRNALALADAMDIEDGEAGI